MTSPTPSRAPSCPAQLSVLCPFAGHQPPPPRSQRLRWTLTIVLAVLATSMVMRWDESRWLRSALAQTAGSGATPMQGGRGIYAFTGQLTSKTYGLFMMDVDSGTLWCYELQHGANGEPQLKLVAARSWVYDRYLEEFNAADPIPSAVKVLVQQQRAAQISGGAATLPGGEERK